MPRPLRWLVHQARCWRWMRRVRAGASALSFQRDYLRSRIWWQSGCEPSERDLDIACAQSFLDALQQLTPPTDR